MIDLPARNDARFINRVKDVIDACMYTAPSRATRARNERQWIYTGSPDGNTAILNRLFSHVDRLASYLYSPRDLRFSMDFQAIYQKPILDMAEVASRVITREFERRDIDMEFGEGVFCSLAHGSCITKLLPSHGGLNCRLVMPWSFGVYREDKNDLGDQEAVCEKIYITRHELWRRISHLPDAQDMYKRAVSHAKKDVDTGNGMTYGQAVVLGATQPVQVTGPFQAGTAGAVDTGAFDSSGQLAPEISEELIELNELWVTDDARGDWTTIQLAEPDVLISPYIRRTNLFINGSGTLPYGLIQPNRMNGYFWGRSEISDLIKLQWMLRDRLEDIKKIMGLQYDRLLAFIGGSGMGDETYDQFRENGWIAMEPGSKVEDLTPKLPDAAFADVKQINEFMDEISGFGNILSGQGEPGVRAGNHAQMLLKTASPRLRDRALLVERQCADMGDKVFQYLRAKEAKAHWGRDNKDFLLADIPDDYRVMVDSHSSSPIYEDEHEQLVAFGLKSGILNGQSAIEMLNYPNKDILVERWMEAEKAKAKMIQEHPELLTKGHAKK